MKMESGVAYAFDAFRLDTARRILLRDGEHVPLPPKVFDTLLVLVMKSGQVVEKEELMQLVWPDTVVEENNLTVNISFLRKALDERPDEHRYVVTVPGRGYRFVAKVREGRDEEDDPSAGEGSKDEDRCATPSFPTWSSSRWSMRRRILAAAVLLAGLLTVAARVWNSNHPGETAGGMTFKSLAVLPFRPLGPDRGDDYLGLGVADSLITRFSSIRQIVVRPISTVQRYLAPGQDPLAAGREQKVDAVLEGSIQRAGEKIRVTVRLLNVRDGSALWTFKCDEQCTDLFSVQDAISERVASALAPSLTEEQRRHLTKRPTENTEAYQNYLKGRFFLGKLSRANYEKAIEYFHRAIALDPDFGPAYAGLAAACIHLQGSPLGSITDPVSEAKAAALRAVQIDDTLPEAHISLAMAKKNHDWDWLGAEQEYKRAIELDPNYALAHTSYASHLGQMDRHEEALVEAKRGLELDPLSLHTNQVLGNVYHMARQYDLAIEQTRRTLELDPYSIMSLAVLASCYTKQRRYEEALVVTNKMLALVGPGFDARGKAQLVFIYAGMGKRADAKRIVSEMREESRRQPLALDVARVYCALGERDKAFEWIERAYVERSWNRLWISLKSSPDWDNLRGDPRFSAVLRRMGFPP
ncbi:MAG: winged helix-turn-helix domain-containing protein [Acidobacteria bacterium]|nr:winged helix-turn-helix domain-containing protein [Acidobacteriota bacterium]